MKINWLEYNPSWIDTQFEEFNTDYFQEQRVSNGWAWSEYEANIDRLLVQRTMEECRRQWELDNYEHVMEALQNEAEQEYLFHNI